VIILVYMHYDSLKVTTFCSKSIMATIGVGTGERRGGAGPDLFEPSRLKNAAPSIKVKSNALFSELIVF